MQKLTLDHSRRTCAQTCLRKYYWQYERNLVPDTGSAALRYGSSWHAALDSLYSTVMRQGWDFDIMEVIGNSIKAAQKVYEAESTSRKFYDDYRNLSNLSTAFLQYLDHFSTDKNTLKVDAVEEAFQIEFPQFIFTGKLDLRVTLSGLPYLLEHKTTGTWLSQAVERLNRSSQTIGYYVACKELGFDIQGVLISIHHLSARKNKDGNWGAPKIDFARSPQIYTARERADWEDMFNYISDALAKAKEIENWTKNYDSCYTFGRCSYLNLCDQHRTFGDENTSGYVEHVWNVLNTVKQNKIHYLSRS